MCPYITFRLDYTKLSRSSPEADFPFFPLEEVRGVKNAGSIDFQANFHSQFLFLRHEAFDHDKIPCERLSAPSLPGEA
jgi:hypothetical protein